MRIHAQNVHYLEKVRKSVRGKTWQMVGTGLMCGNIVFQTRNSEDMHNIMVRIMNTQKTIS